MIDLLCVMHFEVLVAKYYAYGFYISGNSVQKYLVFYLFLVRYEFLTSVLQRKEFPCGMGLYL